MRRDFVNGFLSMVIFTILLGFAYPMLVTGVSQAVFPGKANGSLIKRNGVVVGSALIGQNFADVVTDKVGKVKIDKNGNPITVPDPRYFQTRPSSTVPADNAAASAFSNLGPNNVATKTAVVANIQGYLALEKPYTPGLTAAQIPVDGASSSASGVDPNIAVANAQIQAHRVAAVRRLPLSTVDSLIAAYTTSRSLGFLGEPAVNVLQLNLALDRRSGSR